MNEFADTGPALAHRPSKSSAGREWCDRRAARQSRHARRDRRKIGAALSARVPPRQAGDRGRHHHLEVRPQRHHPAAAAGAEGPRLREDLEPRAQRVPAQDDHALAGGKARRRAAAAAMDRGRLGDALRQSGAARAHRRADVSGLRPHSRRSALSAIRRGDHGDGRRRGVPRADEDALAADAAPCAALLRRSRLYRGAGDVARRASQDLAVRAGGDHRVLSRHPAGTISTRATRITAIARRRRGCCASGCGSTRRSCS